MNKGLSLLLFSIVLCIIVVLCGKSTKYETLIFPETRQSTVTYISGEEEILPNAFKMAIVDSMIMMAGPLDNRWIHAYHFEGGQPSAHYLPNGPGPDEVISGFEFQQTPSGTDVFDIVARQVKRFNHDWQCISSWASDLSKDSLVVKKVHFMPNGSLLVEVNTDRSYSKQGFTIMQNGKRGNVYLDSPMDDEPADKACMLDRHCIAFSPDGKRFACATLEGFILEIFDVEGIDINVRATRKFYPYESVEQDGFVGYSESNIKGVVSMAASDKYVVASFNGTPDGMSPTDISVWDWDGNPIRRYTTDVIILAMCLSSCDNDELYALVQPKDAETRIAKIRCAGLLD